MTTLPVHVAMPSIQSDAPAKPGQIHALLTKVMDGIGAIGKERHNDQQRYYFRGIDELYNAAQPAMIAAGVTITPTSMQITHREERKSRSNNVLIYTIILATYRFYAPDGSFVEATTIGEGMDSGDKSANKAMSAAQKYALLQVLCIPTEEAKDSENDSHDVQPREQQQNSRQAPQRGNAAPQRPTQQKPAQQSAPTGTDKPSHKFYRDLAAASAKLGVHASIATAYIKHALADKGYKSTDELTEQQLKAILHTLGEGCKPEQSKVAELTQFAVFEAAKKRNLTYEEANQVVLDVTEVIDANGKTLGTLSTEGRKRLLADVAAGKFDPQPVGPTGE